MSRRRLAQLALVPIEQLTTPREGDTMIDRWWAVRDGCALFYRPPQSRGWSPQCNTDRRVTETLAGRLWKGDTTPTLIRCAYLGHFDPEWGHMMPWIERDWITEVERSRG